MFLNAMGLILADHDRVHLNELVSPRALAAVPFGGRYRIIDFALSNLVSSGCRRVGVVALTKYKSLMDHLGTGSSWDLDRMKQGLAILPPYINSVATGPESTDLTGLLDFVAGSRQKYLIIIDSNVIMNTTYNDFIERHEDSGADMTIMYNRDGNKFGSPSFALDLDRRGFVKDFMVDAPDPKTLRSSLGVMCLSRELFISMISEAIARGHKDFSIEVLLKHHKEYRIRGYEYKGQTLRFNSVASYFQSSMELLNENVRQELFNSDYPVYTKVKNEAPSIYSEGNYVSNSLISDGCRIMGSVEDSILFRGVLVSKHAKIRNCVIMQDVQLMEGVELSNVIIDKNCVARTGVKLLGQPEYPVIIGKGAII